MSARPLIPTPLVTPLTRDERVETNQLRALVDHVLDGGVDALFVLATTGEFAGLRAQDRIHAAETVVEAAEGRVPVWAGVGDTSTARVLANMDALAGLGIDAYVVSAPFYMSNLSQNDLEDHFVAVAERSGEQIVIYNIPQNTHVTIEPETAARLAAHELIIGAKDSSADFVRHQRLISLTAESPGFVVYTGQERLAAASLLLGAHGLVTGMANVVPEVVQALHAACAERDIDRARNLQRWLADLSDAISEDFWLRGIKAALGHLGICDRYTVGPWSADLAPERVDSIVSVLEANPVEAWTPTKR
jgi:dihydrodipicolinate synthase/N-acetylneuraminate lyase